MTRKFILFFLFLISFSLCIQAQYTEVVNSNQPGFSESPYSVGKRVYQFESSLFHRNADASETFSNPKATGLEFQFRTGLFLEKLELNLSADIQNNTFAFKNVFESSTTEFSLSQLTLAAKYLVFAPDYKKKSEEIRSWNKRHSFGWDRWIPHVAVYAGLNFGSALNEFHERGGITSKIGVLLQNELSNELNIVTNLFYNYIGGELPEFSYVLTATYNFNFKWSGFAEHQALFNKQEKQSNLGLGIAYLFSNNLQINSTAKATFQDDNNIGFYAGVGASYRIDRHIDDFVELDEFGNSVDPLTKESYNKGFFGKMFDKVKGIFKKKDKKEIEIDEDIADPQTENGKTTGRKRTRQKSILGDITKDDKKDKKETVKEKKKLSKKELKALEKERKNTIKEKEKALKEVKKQEVAIAKEEADLIKSEAKAIAKEQAALEKEEADLAKEEAKLLKQEQDALEKEEAAQLKEEAKLEQEIKELEEELKKEAAKAAQDDLDQKYKDELDKKKKETTDNKN